MFQKEAQHAVAFKANMPKAARAEGVLENIAVVIGMPRAGTTWLYENFRRHPGIALPDYKEVNRYFLNISDQQYLDYFPDADGKLRLDVSPLYYLDKNVLAQIARKHDKVVLMVRNEKEWVESLNAQIAKYGGKVDEYVRSGTYEFTVVNGGTVFFDYKNYRHEEHIREVKAMFGDKLLTIEYSRLVQQPLETLKAIERHFGVQPYFDSSNYIKEKLNASSQNISKVYSLLYKTKVLDKLIPIALAVLPKRFVHWLRSRFVYGGK